MHELNGLIGLDFQHYSERWILKYMYNPMEESTRCRCGILHAIIKIAFLVVVSPVCGKLDLLSSSSKHGKRQNKHQDLGSPVHGR
jgi:hypothetical protein